MLFQDGVKFISLIFINIFFRIYTIFDQKFCILLLYVLLLDTDKVSYSNRADLDMHTDKLTVPIWFFLKENTSNKTGEVRIA